MRYLALIMILATIGCSPDKSSSTHLPKLSALIVERPPDAILLEEIKNNRDQVNQLDWRGATPLMYALGIHLNDPERMALQSSVIKETKESPQIVETLLISGADPNSVSRVTKVSPLLLAVNHGWLSSTEVLLRNGADPNLAVGDQTPLMIAAHRCYKDLALVLLARGATPNYRNVANETALMIAEKAKCQSVSGILTSTLAQKVPGSN